MVFVSVEARPRIHIPLTTHRFAAHKSEGAGETSDSGTDAAVRISTLDERQCCKFMPLAMPATKSSSKLRSFKRISRNSISSSASGHSHDLGSGKSDENAADWINSAVKDPLVEIDPVTMEQLLKNRGVDSSAGSTTPVAISPQPLWQLFSSPAPQGFGSVLLALGATIFVASLATVGYLMRNHSQGIEKVNSSKDGIFFQGGKSLAVVDPGLDDPSYLSDEERRLDLLSIVDGGGDGSSESDGVGDASREEIFATPSELEPEGGEIFFKENTGKLEFEDLKVQEPASFSDEVTTSSEDHEDRTRGFEGFEASGSKGSSKEEIDLEEDMVTPEVVVAAAIAATASLSREFQRAITEKRQEAHVESLEEIVVAEMDESSESSESEDDVLTNDIVRDVLADLAALEAMEREKAAMNRVGSLDGARNTWGDDELKAVEKARDGLDEVTSTASELYGSSRVDDKVLARQSIRRQEKAIPSYKSNDGVQTVDYGDTHKGYETKQGEELRRIHSSDDSQEKEVLSLKAYPSADVDVEKLNHTPGQHSRDNMWMTKSEKNDNQMIYKDYKEEIKKIVQAVVPAVAVGAGAISMINGVDAALEMVGFAATASFVWYDLLWAETRQDLYKDFQGIKNHKELLQFLRSKKIVQPKV
ncbi:hypothetical protein SELMODRAFT_445890 [Selaginella moellendorffii]|uniref:Uncharacterized protein n=2 Tax=Selaginella moellendorffii TaxID=88036 RepID=D8SM37_SELML|nr:uncharacterized protein LOC9644407 isoform X1 [Selaginella moellendorffii]EFJ14421.1 hypothetical protein SELMODRAFT_445890 [Selaginella moellendorffii]|eukprot:XP_002984371.1 uncharacterized protein LOC9644407 isoform X1 [Selaginella moellendorffii]